MYWIFFLFPLTVFGCVFFLWNSVEMENEWRRKRKKYCDILYACIGICMWASKNLYNSEIESRTLLIFTIQFGKTRINNWGATSNKYSTEFSQTNWTNSFEFDSAGERIEKTNKQTQQHYFHLIFFFEYTINTNITFSIYIPLCYQWKKDHTVVFDLVLKNDEKTNELELTIAHRKEKSRPHLSFIDLKRMF